LLDLYMTDINGFEILKILREQEKTRDIPVMLITGEDGIEEEKKGYELGATDYIHKPVDPWNLIERIHGHLFG